MRLLLRFSVGFVCAAALVLRLLPAMAAAGVGIALLGLGLILCIRRHGVGPVVLGLALGILWTLGWQTVTARHALTPGEREITGVVTDYSTVTAYGVQVPARITDGTGIAAAQVWLSTDTPLKPGDRFTVSASLKDAGESGSGYYAEGVRMLAFGRGTVTVTPVASVPVRYLPRLAAHRLEEVLLDCVPPEAAGYAVALVTGERSYLTAGQREDLKTSGIYHALCLSGMHLTALVSVAALLIRRRRRRAWIGIPLCVAFALLTGARTPMVRAAVMECMLLAAPLFGREEDPPTSLGLAAVLLTLWNPWCVFGVGTQLSFASVAGILLLAGRINGLLGGRRRKKKDGRLRRWLRASVSVTGAALAGTAPLMALYAGSVSLISPLTNLLTGWMVTACFRGSLLTALLGLACRPLGMALGWAVGWGIRYIQLVAEVLARVPFASLSTGTVYGAGWLLMTYCVLAVALLGKTRPVIPAAGIVLGLTVCLLLTTLQGRALEMTVLDVGQGQCLLFSCRGQTVLVDCGGSLGEAVGDLAANRLSGLGRTQVDALILTHYDTDHISGVPELLRRLRVRYLLLPEMEPQRPERLLVEAAALENGTELIPVTDRTRLRFGGGQLDLFPPVTDAGGNAGLSALVDVGNTTVLVTGDMGMEQERELLRRWPLPDVDVLVAGHHGAKTSTSQALLETVRPEAVMISVGRNSYGHPAEETLERLRQAGARIYRTDQNGTITLRGA